MQPFAYGVTYSNSKTSIIIDNYGYSTSLSPVAELKSEIYIYLISTLIIYICQGRGQARSFHLPPCYLLMQR